MEGRTGNSIVPAIWLFLDSIHYCRAGVRVQKVVLVYYIIQYLDSDSLCHYLMIKYLDGGALIIPPQSCPSTSYNFNLQIAQSPFSFQPTDYSNISFPIP